MFISGGIGTNLKVRGRGKHIIFCHAPPRFLAIRVQLVVFGLYFHDGHYSLFSFLFAILLLMVPHALPFVKVGGGARAPHALWSRRHRSSVSLD